MHEPRADGLAARPRAVVRLPVHGREPRGDLAEGDGDRDVGVGTGMLNMTGQLGAAAGISILSALVDDGSSADRFLAVLAIAAAIEIIAVAMVGAIRFRGPITTRTTPASPTAPYSAVVDLDRGRE